jgi:hypothetical protein
MEGPSETKSLNTDIRIEDFDKVESHPQNHFNSMSFSKEDLTEMGRKARNELSDYLHDVHGDRPVFDFPVLSFDDNLAKANYKSIGKKLWRYISKDILDKYKPVEKVYAINVCHSKKMQEMREKELLQYFTYGKHVKIEVEKFDATASKRKNKLRIKRKDKHRMSIAKHDRSGSKRGSSTDIKHIFHAASKRKTSNTDSAEHFIKNKELLSSSRGIVNDGELTSGSYSEASRSVSRHGEETFTKSVLQAKENENEEVVQEVDDEDNSSDLLSSKKLARRKSIRRQSILKLKRRNSIK